MSPERLQPTTTLQLDAAWAMAGAMAQTAYQAAFMIVLAHVSTSAVVGQYALGLAIAAPLNVFADRAVRMLQATAHQDDFPLRSYLALRILAGAAALLLTAGICLVSPMGAMTSVIVLIVAAGRFVEGIAQTYYGRLQREHRMPQIGQSQVIRAALSAVASLICLFLWQEIVLALVAGLTVNLAVLLVFDRKHIIQLEASNGDATALSAAYAFDESFFSRELAALHSMLGLAVPLAASTFFVSVNINLPRLMLSVWTNESTLGVFAILVYACFPATMITSAVMQAATPRLARLFRIDRQEGYRQLANRLVFACAGIGLGNWWMLYLFGHSILDWALGPEYASSAGELGWIAAATGIGFVASVPATAMNARRLFRLSMITCGFSCAITLIAAVLLIPHLLMKGAALTMVITNSVHLIVSYTALRLTSDTEPRTTVNPLDRAA